MFEKLNQPKIYLMLGNVLLASFLILLSNLKVIPLHFGDFLFFAFLTLAFALYRPGWCFLLFIGMLPLENINLAPVELGLNVRPYQFIGAIIILALMIRLATRRLSFKLIKPVWYDWLVLILVLSGFLSITGAPDKISSFKLSIIIGTFAALYYLVRNYIQDSEDLKRIIPFFLSSSAVVVLYGIWQNWRFLHNINNFETMPGRPNATFTEADWLGIYLVLLISVIFALIYFRHSEHHQNDVKNLPNNTASDNQWQILRFSFWSKLRMTASHVFLILSFILLVITVSRSAWLGTFAVMFMLLFITLTNLRFRNWHWVETIQMGLKMLATLIIALGIVFIFHLTNFQLRNRVQSAETGLQKITISCNQNVNLPEKISDVSELQRYGCRHINLEDIDLEKAQGKYVTEIFRNDPNVQTRSEIYRKSWEQIKNHPLFGIGWGSIGGILGKDGRGVPLNSSNIFLETWLGAGILGFLALVVLLGYILFNSVKNYYFARDELQKVTNLFIIVSWFAIVVPNMFNAGIFLGIFWVWLAIVKVKD